MAHKEFVGLLENSILLMGWLTLRIKNDDEAASLGYSVSFLRILVRIFLAGKVSLKTLAKHIELSPSNLCAMLRQLEKDGMVSNQRDKVDRRVTWYSVTYKGEKIAKKAMEKFRNMIDEIFRDLSERDEVRLTKSLATLNAILSEIKNSYGEGAEK